MRTFLLAIALSCGSLASSSAHPVCPRLAPMLAGEALCNGQGFGMVAVGAGEYCVTVTGTDAESCRAGKNFLKEVLGIGPPTNCPECPDRQTGCRPGNYTEGGTGEFDCAANRATNTTEVCFRVQGSKVRYFKVCGLCEVEAGGPVPR